MTIYFYTPREQPYGCFSNFSRHGVDLDGAWWPTTEHYFQAQKFVDTFYAETIRAAYNPKQAAELGRSRKMPLRPDWERVKDAVMLKAVQRKFELHAEIREILLSTGEEEIVENAPGDYYWGCGADGSGRNQLGKTLVQVREILRQTPGLDEEQIDEIRKLWDEGIQSGISPRKVGDIIAELERKYGIESEE